ncbi:MAG: nuclear transport factor 2 family protein [Alphaproteobacteria bacterium]|nr:nuclear transport factor 2 family protein [Alphaproteobacteria bacterium]
MIRRSIIALVTVFTALGAPLAAEAEPAADELLAAERAFSARSATIGFVAAMAEVLADDAVILQDGSPPIVGKEAVIASRLAGELPPAAKARLTWEPMAAHVSALRDLGYTYGIYTFSYVAKDTTAKESKGTYATIWRRDVSGAWKVVLDTGTEGLEPPQPK